MTQENRTITLDSKDEALLLYGQRDAHLRMIRDLGLHTGFVYENGRRMGSFPEHFTRAGADLNLSRRITEKLSAGLGYRFLIRHSDLPSSSYTDNSILVTLAYRF